MEKTTVLTKLDYRALKYCNLFILKFKRKPLIWTIISVIICIALVFYNVFFLKESYILTVLAVLFIVYALYNFLTLEKRLDIQLERFFYGRSVQTQTVEITDEKVTITRSADPDNIIDYDWSFITEICEMPQYYILMIGRGVPIIVDRSEDAIIEGTKSNLDAIIHEKAKSRPYKVTYNDIVKKPITYVHEHFDVENTEVKQEFLTKEEVNAIEAIQEVVNETNTLDTTTNNEDNETNKE